MGRITLTQFFQSFRKHRQIERQSLTTILIRNNPV